MRFTLVTSSGEPLGRPADIPTINSWIAEGIVRPETVLVDDAGNNLIASQIPGLGFPNSPGINPVPSGSKSSRFASCPRPHRDGVQDDLYNKFNWGAFAFTWIWCLNHKRFVGISVLGLTIAVAVFFPHLSSPFLVGTSIALGKAGNQIAWSSGRFESMEQMAACQAVWAKWAYWTIPLVMCLVVAAAVMFP